MSQSYRNGAQEELNVETDGEKLTSGRNAVKSIEQQMSRFKEGAVHISGSYGQSSFVFGWKHDITHDIKGLTLYMILAD